MTTSNDAKVLNAILNPNTPFEEQTVPEVTPTSNSHQVFQSILNLNHSLQFFRV